VVKFKRFSAPEVRTLCCKLLNAAVPSVRFRPLAVEGPARTIEHPIDLARHDEIVLVQSFYLLSAQGNRHITPAEADVGVMAFSFREFTNLLNKGKRFAEIAGTKTCARCGLLRQLPVWGLCLKELSLLAREWRYSPATGEYRFF
jgi:hypothetical protein